MTVTLGHFDIWDIWDLHLFWKMSLFLLVHHVYWWDLSRKHYQILLKVRIHPPTHPQNTQRQLKTPPVIPDTPPVPQNYRWLFPITHQAFWGAFQLSRDFRENSGSREGVKRCLFSVWNVYDCLRLPRVMSRACQGCYMRVWGYLRVS